MPSAIGINIFPQFMQPIAAHLTCFLNRTYMDRALKVLGPYIEQRIMQIENRISKTQPQNDVMAWLIGEALRKKESCELMSQLIASRVFATTMAALEAVTLTRALEEEARHVLRGPINQDSIDKLHFADAAIKKGLRLQTALKALTVQVMHPTRITIKDIGFHIERASAEEGWSIHGSFLHEKKMDRASTAPLPRHYRATFSSASSFYLDFGHGLAEP
ncbi:hypothetical protein HYE67_000077 [Fusarium culmorum]|uniref:Uncharacterized protein n=1 Tax=Fusarium culmorum TaxID=5516 RepID=A0A7S8CX36_FUSCU|nr:hypothetical protein HYE67_000077 [Fusarium culmorum]